MKSLFRSNFSLVNHRRVLAEVGSASTGLLGAVAGVMFPVISVVTLLSFGVHAQLVGTVINLVVGASLGVATAVASLRVARMDLSKALEPADSVPGISDTS